MNENWPREGVEKKRLRILHTETGQCEVPRGEEPAPRELQKKKKA